MTSNDRLNAFVNKLDEITERYETCRKLTDSSQRLFNLKEIAREAKAVNRDLTDLFVTEGFDDDMADVLCAANDAARLAFRARRDLLGGFA